MPGDETQTETFVCPECRTKWTVKPDSTVHCICGEQVTGDGTKPPEPDPPPMMLVVLSRPDDEGP